jgi:hypothetical protein
MKMFISKLKAIWSIIFAKYGVIIFKQEPTSGDTIKVGRYKAIFIKEDN